MAPTGKESKGESLKDYFGLEESEPTPKKKAPAAAKPKKPLSEPWRSRKPPPVTTQYGHEVRRVGYASLRRALDDVSDTTHERPNDYAMVFCEGLGISLTRDGSRARTATFSLRSCHPAHTLTLKGTEGRDKLIKRFLSIWKKRKSFCFPPSNEPEVAREERKKRK